MSRRASARARSPALASRRALMHDLFSRLLPGNQIDRADRFVTCGVRSKVIQEGPIRLPFGGHMRCSKCGTEGIPGKKFCAECGSPLSNRCSKCHSDNAPGAKFCADCGSALGTDVVAEGGKPSAAEAAGGVRIAPERQTSEAIEGERKTVTALFADIKGSMELMRDLDPEEARAIVDPALKLMMDAAHRYDGYIVRSTGDGIFALFGAPVAHEDHPQRALHAAIAMRDALRRSGEELKKQ